MGGPRGGGQHTTIHTHSADSANSNAPTHRSPHHPYQTAGVVALALLLGSTATLVPKVLLRSPCDASCVRSGESSNTFGAPIWATSVVFVAAIVGLSVESAAAAVQPGDTASRAVADTRTWSRFLKLVLPGTLNTLSVLLQLLSLLWIPAAALAGMRGFLLLFTAMLSKAMALPDAPASIREWACIFVSAFGAVLVGAASWLDARFYPVAGSEDAASASPSSSTVGLGLATATLGYTFAALQVATEQRLIGAGTYTKWQIMGVEGLWGLSLCAALGGTLALAGPDVSAARMEVPSHTLCCLQHSPSLSGLSVAYGASSLAFNACLLVLAARLGANWRVFIFTARGLLTWTAEATLFYAGEASLGEAITPFSALLLGGYALLIGSGLYRSILQGRGGGPARTPAATGTKAAERGEAQQPLLFDSELDSSGGGGCDGGVVVVRSRQQPPLALATTVVK